jgi:hypothetical protein
MTPAALAANRAIKLAVLQRIVSVQLKSSSE